MSKIYRREFDQATAATVAAMVVGKAQADAVQTAPSENLHYALIGAGSQGRFDSSCLLQVPGVKLTAICDINPYHVAEAKKLAPEARVYEDWNELFTQEKDLQAALVALPEDTHAPASIAAMESGLVVFCEKPMAFALAHDKLASVHLNDQNGLKFDQDQSFGSANLRSAFNQVRVLEEAGFGRRGEFIGLDVKAMRTQTQEQSLAHLKNSRAIFLHLLGKVRTLDKELEQSLIDARDNEQLEIYTLQHTYLVCRPKRLPSCPTLRKSSPHNRCRLAIVYPMLFSCRILTR